MTDPLDAWVAARSAVASAPATIVAVGDSITEGSHASDRAHRWLDVLRTSLRTRLGLAAGGVGYTPAAFSSGLRGDGMSWTTAATITGGWSDMAFAGFGYRGLQSTSAGTITWSVLGSSADLWYLTFSGGGSFSWRVDGGSPTTISTDSVTWATARTTIALGADDVHTVTVTWVSGAVGVCGISAYHGDATSGIHVVDAAHYGYSTGAYLGLLGSDPTADEAAAVQTAIGALGPDLVIVALGAGDYIDHAYSTTDCAAHITTLVSTYIGQGASVLVMGAYRVVDSVVAPGQDQTWASYLSAMQAAAVAAGAAWLDLSATMPQADTTGSGYYHTDGVHPNDAGHAHIAGLLLDILAPEAAEPAWPLPLRVEAAFGADRTALPGTWAWTDITAWVLRAVEVSRGGADRYSTLQPGKAVITVDNSDGRWTEGHPASPLLGVWGEGTPIRISCAPTGSYVTRLLAFVDTIAYRSPGTEHAEADVTIQGTLYGLRQGVQIGSALRMTLMGEDIRPVAYWSMEDGRDSTSFASAVSSTAPPIQHYNLSPGADSQVTGSDPLPTVGSYGYWWGVVPGYSASTEWAIRFKVKIPSAPTTNTGIIAWTTGGSITRWVLAVDASKHVWLEGYDSGGTERLGEVGGGITLTAAWGTELWIAVHASQSGGSIAWEYWVHTPDGGAGRTGSTAATIGNVQIVFMSAYPGLIDTGCTYGHVAVAADTDYVLVSGPSAAVGWARDTAVTRWVRLCNVSRRAISWSDSLDSSYEAVLGPWTSGDLMSGLQAVIAADQGFGWERVGSELCYRPIGTEYNRTVALALDFAAGHVMLDFGPVSDAFSRANDWTVSRKGGSSAHALAPEVDPSDPDHNPAVPVKPDTITVDLADDAPLPWHASWRAHMGSGPRLRVPTLRISLRRNSDLIAAWLACDIGSRITVANPPAWMPPGTLDLVVVGYTEHLSSMDWWVEINCADYRPYLIGQWAAESGDTSPYCLRLDTDGSALSGGPYSAVATSLTVTSTGAPWTTAADDRPFDVQINGERMTVTGVSGASSPQTFTVVRAVNGVSKTHAAGEAVSLYAPLVLGL